MTNIGSPSASVVRLSNHANAAVPASSPGQETAAASPLPAAPAPAAASFDRTTAPRASLAPPERAPASAPAGPRTNPLQARLQAMTAGTPSAEPSNGFAGRVADEMKLNWPGYTFAGTLGAGAGLLLGAPVVAVAAAIAAPIAMGIHVVREDERTFGAPTDSGG
jgi:hypothetical protein